MLAGRDRQTSCRLDDASRAALASRRKFAGETPAMQRGRWGCQYGADEISAKARFTMRVKRRTLRIARIACRSTISSPRLFREMRNTAAMKSARAGSCPGVRGVDAGSGDWFVMWPGGLVAQAGYLCCHWAEGRIRDISPVTPWFPPTGLARRWSALADLSPCASPSQLRVRRAHRGTAAPALVRVLSGSASCRKATERRGQCSNPITPEIGETGLLQGWESNVAPPRSYDIVNYHTLKSAPSSAGVRRTFLADKKGGWGGGGGTAKPDRDEVYGKIRCIHPITLATRSCSA